MTKWAVIACDQFSSEREYWERVEKTVGNSPSSLRLMVPEAFLGDEPSEKAAAKRAAAMREYLESGVFKELKDAFVFVRRGISGGETRLGLVGMMDLDAYEYTEGTTAPIRASEKTVADRLPPRIAVRREASLEMPHVMVLINDPEKTVIEPLEEKKEELPILYDFDLMEGGGHITGFSVTGRAADDLGEKLDALFASPLCMVIGDGNHSLAAAKALWDEIKPGLSEKEREACPARFALIEVNNAYGAGMEFEPIHRAVFGVDADKFAAFLKARFTGGDRTIRFVTAKDSGELSVRADTHGALVAAVQGAVDDFIAENGGEVDYIHDDDTAISLGKKENAAAILLPAMGRGELFTTVEAGQVFPKKSFSIGHARDKRYYLECRGIR
ncbi:MAG: DUF1015 domain-containing protein [Oscillospiraceae bacterium]|nr:DUF1015 domain-containing protein [Oscillospiraceae bacterium]